MGDLDWVSSQPPATSGRSWPGPPPGKTDACPGVTPRPGPRAPLPARPDSPLLSRPPEVLLDPCRTWCPASACQAVCQLQEMGLQTPQLVQCKACDTEFCSACRASWHPGQGCPETVPITFLPGDARYLCAQWARAGGWGSQRRGWAPPSGSHGAGGEGGAPAPGSVTPRASSTPGLFVRLSLVSGDALCAAPCAEEAGCTLRVQGASARRAAAAKRARSREPRRRRPADGGQNRCRSRGPCGGLWPVTAAPLPSRALRAGPQVDTAAPGTQWEISNIRPSTSYEPCSAVRFG